MRHALRLSILSAIAASLFLSPHARAEGDPAAAAVLFKDGRELAKAGDYAAACPKLADSYRLDPGVGTLLNLADCEEHIDKIASAWAHYGEALERIPPEDGRQHVAKARMTALEPRLPHLTIVLVGAPPDAKIMRDGVELGQSSLGTALPIDAGTHRVEIIAPQRLNRGVDVKLADGENRRVEIAPGDPAPVVIAAAPTAPPIVSSAPAPAPASGVNLRTVGFVAAGVGVVGIGIAIGTGLALPSKQTTIDAHCNAATNLCDADGFGAAQSGKTLATANTIAWIGGGVALAAGAALIVFGGRDRSKPAAAFAPFVSPSSGGAAFRGTF